MGQNQATSTGYPIHSLQRLRELGLDPARVPSCAPTPAESGNRAVLGCQCHAQCRFDRPPYCKAGAPFKGVEPQRVGYFYRTIEGNEKTDQIACHQFVMTLQSAQDEAVAAELRGERHETVRIIAWQGESFKRVVTRVGPLRKDGSTDWRTEVREVEIGPMADRQQDPYDEYRHEVAQEYDGGGSTLPAVTPTAAPGRPVAQPAGAKRG